MPWIRKPVDRPDQDVRDAWYRAGHILPPRDHHRGANEGLGDREIKDLLAENAHPWSNKSFAAMFISNRAKQAVLRALARQEVQSKRAAARGRAAARSRARRGRR